MNNDHQGSTKDIAETILGTNDQPYFSVLNQSTVLMLGSGRSHGSLVIRAQLQIP